MKISELLAAVDDEHIEFQTLETDLHAANKNGKHAIITFNTASEKVMDMLLNDGRKFMGLIIWLPREKADAAIANARNQ